MTDDFKAGVAAAVELLVDVAHRDDSDGGAAPIMPELHEAVRQMAYDLAHPDDGSHCAPPTPAEDARRAAGRELVRAVLAAYVPAVLAAAENDNETPEGLVKDPDWAAFAARHAV